MRSGVVIVALAGVLAATGAGCSASADLSGVAEAAGKTQDAKSIYFSFDVVGVPDETARAEGALDLERDSGYIDVDGPDPEFKMIWVGNELYVKSPSFSAVVADGKPWVKLKSEEMGAFSSLAYFDPARQFELLQSAGSFKAKGTEDIRGVPATRYEGTVDAKRFIEAFAPKSEKLDVPETAEGVQFAVTAWIDREGRLRKVFYDLPALDDGDYKAAQMTLELYDFGKPVDVTPPPAGQVGDFKMPTHESGGEVHTLTFESASGG